MWFIEYCTENENQNGRRVLTVHSWKHTVPEEL